MAWSDFWTALAQSYDGNKINPFAFARAFSPTYRGQVAAGREAETATNQGVAAQERANLGGYTSPAGFRVAGTPGIAQAGMWENIISEPGRRAATEAGTAATRGQEGRQANAFSWLTQPENLGDTSPRGQQFRQQREAGQAGIGAQQAQTATTSEALRQAQERYNLLRTSPGMIPDHFDSLEQWLAYQPILQDREKSQLGALSALVNAGMFPSPTLQPYMGEIAQQAGLRGQPQQPDPFDAALKRLQPGQAAPVPGAQAAPPAGKPNFGFGPARTPGTPLPSPGGMPPEAATQGFPVPPQPQQSFMEKYVVPDFGKIWGDVKQFLPKLQYEVPPTSKPGYLEQFGNGLIQSLQGGGQQQEQLPYIQTPAQPGQRQGLPQPLPQRQPTQRNMQMMQPAPQMEFPALLPPQNIPEGSAVRPQSETDQSLELVRAMIAALLQQQGVI